MIISDKTLRIQFGIIEKIISAKYRYYELSHKNLHINILSLPSVIKLFSKNIIMIQQISKRHQALKPLSEEHNEVLLLSYRIGAGLRQNVDGKRIKKYVDWFKTEYLDPHFALENKYIFPILGERNVRMKRALANHRRLNRLFDETSNLNIVLNKIEEELGSFIRFEERILYNEIQKVATREELLMIENVHHEIDFVEGVWEDKFWEI